MNVSSKTEHSRAVVVQQTNLEFYPRIIDFFNPIYKISQKECEVLNSASTAYFQALIIIDGIFDQSIATYRLKEALNHIEVAIKLLSLLFDAHHPFWIDFERNKEKYFTTLRTEKNYSTEKKQLTEEDFNRIATGKSSVCYSIVNALSHLSDQHVAIGNEDVIFLLKEIHIAFQCKDDVDDFLDDIEVGQYTYAHALTFESLRKEAGVQNNPSNEFLYRYFYVSGQAQRLISKAITHFEQAIHIAINYRLQELCTFIHYEIEIARSQIDEIQLLIDKTKAKANLATQTILRSSNVTNGMLENTIHRSVNFILNSFEDQYSLSDFMTSAGLGKNWISSYAAFLLADYPLAADIIERLKKSDALAYRSDNQNSYNVSIVQDADSMSFGLAARKLLFDNVKEYDLNEWKKFQDPAGGWQTYFDEQALRQQIQLDDSISLKGWATSHNCVSASACYILSLFPNEKETYFKTAEFLAKQLNENGSLGSYWWLSPVYATAWFIIAFSQDDLLKEKCQRSVDWLAGMQTVNGSWKSDRILVIPQTDVMSQSMVKSWRNSSFGVNICVDDHKRVFTTLTVLSVILKKIANL